jgi:streptogrisin C
MAAMQRDLKLSAKAARTRLITEDKAARTEAQLRQALGARFGGAWLSADAGTLVVGVTSTSEAERVRAAGGKAVVVARSEQHLDAAKAKLDQAKAPASVAGWYVDPASNNVVVVAKTAAAAKTFVAGTGVDAAAVRVVESAEAPRPLADVRGGDAFFINGSGRCSIGFSVSGGFVTAGHCGRTGSSTAGTGRVAQGTFKGSSFPGNDYAFVQVNSNWKPVGVVNDYKGGTIKIAGSQEAPVGASICRSGSTTGYHCGTVQAKNATVNYAEGSVSGLTRTNVCAEPGDSGGSWVSGSQAQGVTSGGSGDCKRGGTTFFQPVTEILAAFGVSLTTSGGGGEPSPGPGPGPGPEGTQFTNAGAARCLAVPNNSQTRGTLVQVRDCGTGADQKWTLTTAGELRIYGNKCLDAFGASTRPGTRAIIWDCHSGANQKWTVDASGAIKGAQSGLCLDAAGAQNGAAVTLRRCTNSALQKWTRK